MGPCERVRALKKVMWDTGSSQALLRPTPARAGACSASLCSRHRPHDRQKGIIPKDDRRLRGQKPQSKRHGFAAPAPLPVSTIRIINTRIVSRHNSHDAVCSSEGRACAIVPFEEKKLIGIIHRRVLDSNQSCHYSS